MPVCVITIFTVSSNYLSNHAIKRQSDPPLLALSNKFDCLQDNTCEADMNKQKETEYLNRIQTLEASISKWNRAKVQWQEKEKKLEEEKMALVHQYDELKAVSEKRNADLQRQIDEIKSYVCLSDDDDSKARKRAKTRSSPTESSITPQILSAPSPGSSQVPDAVINMETAPIERSV